MHDSRVVVLCAVTLAVTGCQLVSLPRPQSALTAQQEHRLSAQAFQTLLADQQRSQHQEYVQLVEQVGGRLESAADRPQWSWEFSVVALDTPRVVALPGGRVAVTEGLLAQCRNEAEVAAVLAHELGHLLAGHGAERWQHAEKSPRDASKPLTSEQRFRTAYGATFDAPGARHDSHQESEADSIGLLLLARAGYDPQTAVGVWAPPSDGKRPSSGAGNSIAHSTHPERASRLQEVLPQAVSIYKRNPQPRGAGQVIVSRPVQPEPQPERAVVTAAARASSAAPASDKWTPRGSAKPNDWSSDLAEGNWAEPVVSDARSRDSGWTATAPRLP